MSNLITDHDEETRTMIEIESLDKEFCAEVLRRIDRAKPKIQNSAPSAKDYVAQTWWP